MMKWKINEWAKFINGRRAIRAHQRSIHLATASLGDRSLGSRRLNGK
jgi:hypothetical protein